MSGNLHHNLQYMWYSRQGLLLLEQVRVGAMQCLRGLELGETVSETECCPLRCCGSKSTLQEVQPQCHAGTTHDWEF